MYFSTLSQFVFGSAFVVLGYGIGMVNYGKDRRILEKPEWKFLQVLIEGMRPTGEPYLPFGPFDFTNVA